MKTFCLKGWLLVKMMALREPAGIPKREFCCIVMPGSHSDTFQRRKLDPEVSGFAVILGGSRLLSVFPGLFQLRENCAHGDTMERRNPNKRGEKKSLDFVFLLQNVDLYFQLWWE